jgi:hypothetical protein
MTRFKVFSADDKKVIHLTKDNYYDLNRWVLAELDKDGNIIDIVGDDYSEPEDASLVRSFSWVPELLNKICQEYEEKLNKKD